MRFGNHSLFTMAMLVGQGCSPDLMVIPAALHLEDPALGVSTTGQFTLQNVGSRKAKGISFEVDAPFSAYASQEDLPAGGTMDVTVSITPEEVGSYGDTLRILTAAFAGGPATVALDAVVLAPILVLADEHPVCGDAAGPGRLRVDILNAGEGPLVITAATITDDCAGDFWDLDDVAPLTIAPQARSWLDMSCDPEASSQGTLLLGSNDPSQPSIDIPLHATALTVQVHSPADQVVWSTEDPQVFTATVEHVDDTQQVQVTWSSDLDSLFMVTQATAGEPFELSDATLSPGTHALQLHAISSDGATATDTRTLHISNPPTAEITRPTLGTLTQEDMNWTFTGTVTDLDQCPETLTARWYSDLAGELPSSPVDEEGSSYTSVLTLEPGLHEITLEVEDEYGLVASTTTDFTVNAAPNVAISTPAEGEVQQDELLLVATVTDQEDSPSQLSCKWSSEGDGDLGTVNGDTSTESCSLTTDATQGDQAITLVVQDTMGGSTTVTVNTFLDGPPELTLISPTYDSWRPEGGELVISGTASDITDASSDLQISWESDLDGALDVATPDSSGAWAGWLTGLTPGLHTITVLAEDTLGSVSTTTTLVEFMDCADTNDLDGDGFSPATGDCDEADPAAYPGAKAGLGDPRGGCWGFDVATIDGTSEVDGLGLEINAGDIDGDGLDDLILGAYSRDNSAGNSVGAIFVAPSTQLVVGGAMTTDNLFAVEGTASTSYLGYDLAVLPDIDGSGSDEFVAAENSSGSSVYLFYGRPTWTGLDAASADLQISPGANVALLGSDMDAADFDGDGLGDLVVGASDSSVIASGGGAFFVFMADSLLAGVSLTDDADFAAFGTDSNVDFGSGVAAAGDVDGDGKPDLLVSSPNANLRGSSSGTVDLFTGVGCAAATGSTILPTAGFVGESSSNYLGREDMVGGVGDVNADLYEDFVLIATGFDSSSQSDAGKAYLWLGSYDLSGVYDVEEPNTGFIGNSNDGFLGDAISAAGDLDGDGFFDFLLGAYKDDSPASNAGRVGVMLGGSMDGWNRVTPFDQADYLLDGNASSDYAGRSVIGDLDLDGTGPPDFAIGAYGAGSDGQVYVYKNHGQTCTSP